ncbi:hypothetical protein EMGBD4_16560 [Verrucomicrobiota bacterium]|nr:hypothetical protein EMGBD4_16560 [Verrucomicrobiota bacterium]
MIQYNSEDLCRMLKRQVDKATKPTPSGRAKAWRWSTCMSASSGAAPT